MCLCVCVCIYGCVNECECVCACACVCVCMSRSECSRELGTGSSAALWCDARLRQCRLCPFSFSSEKHKVGGPRGRHEDCNTPL